MMATTIDVAFLLVHLFTTAFILWILFRAEHGLHFRPVGLALVAALVAGIPLVVWRTAAPIVGQSVPPAIAWTSIAHGSAGIATILLLLIRPGLVGYIATRRVSA